MPLVEENRALHKEVAILKAALAEQNVKWDEMIERNQRPAVHYIDVAISPLQRITMSPEEGRHVLAQELARNMLGEIQKMAFRVEPSMESLGELTYRFAFLKVGK